MPQDESRRKNLSLKIIGGELGDIIMIYNILIIY